MRPTPLSGNDRAISGILSVITKQAECADDRDAHGWCWPDAWPVDGQVWEYDEETGGQVAMLVDSPTLQAGCGDPDAVG
jgi:hypothetical protein